MALAVVCTGCGKEGEPESVKTDGESVVVTRRSDEKQFVEKDGRKVGGEYDVVGPTHLLPGGEV
ncbi:MAG: hypothetical protein ACOC8E_05835, partial [Planctomycetota bacterium]